jgi:hypothetical protein
MAEIFISYGREDRDEALALREALAARGFSVWWDATLAQSADRRFRDELLSRLEAASVVIALWSRASVASHWCREEMRRAAARRRGLPIAVADFTWAAWDEPAARDCAVLREYNAVARADFSSEGFWQWMYGEIEEALGAEDRDEGNGLYGRIEDGRREETGVRWISKTPGQLMQSARARAELDPQMRDAVSRLVGWDAPEREERPGKAGGSRCFELASMAGATARACGTAITARRWGGEAPSPALLPARGREEPIAEIVGADVTAEARRRLGGRRLFHSFHLCIALQGTEMKPAAGGFSGWAKELAALSEALWDREMAEVTVHGLGGIGKSSLAREFAWQDAIDRYEKLRRRAGDEAQRVNDALRASAQCMRSVYLMRIDKKARAQVAAELLGAFQDGEGRAIVGPMSAAGNIGRSELLAWRRLAVAEFLRRCEAKELQTVILSAPGPIDDAAALSSLGVSFAEAQPAGLRHDIVALCAGAKLVIGAARKPDAPLSKWSRWARADCGAVPRRMLGALLVRQVRRGSELNTRPWAGRDSCAAEVFVKPWLRVCDSDDDAHTLKEWALGGTVHALATSRLGGWQLGVSAVEDEDWGLPEAVTYAIGASRRSDIGEDEAIAGVLGRLGLAMSDAPADVCENADATAGSYLAALEAHRNTASTDGGYRRAAFGAKREQASEVIWRPRLARQVWLELNAIGAGEPPKDELSALPWKRGMPVEGVSARIRLETVGQDGRSEIVGEGRAYRLDDFWLLGKIWTKAPLREDGVYDLLCAVLLMQCRLIAASAPVNIYWAPALHGLKLDTTAYAWFRPVGRNVPKKVVARLMELLHSGAALFQVDAACWPGIRDFATEFFKAGHVRCRTERGLEDLPLLPTREVGVLCARAEGKRRRR